MVTSSIPGLLVALAVATVSTAALSFSPEEEQQFGDRRGERLDGYAPLSSRLTLEEAKGLLGRNVLESPCAIGNTPARCLTYFQMPGALSLMAKHYFVDDRNQVAIVHAMPIGVDGPWIPLQYCAAVAARVLHDLKVLHGLPDNVYWPANFTFDPNLSPEWPSELPGGRYRIEAARFLFPRGGEIRLEYIELPGRSCMVRQIYYWGQ